MEIIEAESVPVASSLRASTWSTPVLVIGLGILLSYGVIYFVAGDLLTQLPRWVLFTFSAFLILFLFIFPLVTRKQNEPNRYTFPSWKQIFWEAIISIPLIFLCVVLTLLTRLAISYFLPDSNLSATTFNQGSGETGTLGFFFLFIMAVFFAPLSEEIFFRGFLFNAFSKRMPLALAVVIQTGVFAALHFFSVAYVIAVIPLGLVLTLVYYWRKTILTSIFVHSGNNALAVIGFFIAMQVAANQPVLGVSGQSDDAQCIVETVHPGSPAEQAGILAGDIITQVDNYTIKEFQDLLEAAANFKPGDSVDIVLMRDGEQVVVEATLVSRKTLSSNLNQAPQP